ncbi:MAG: SPASM domain-containing protein [Chitinophagales bacterium]|nr:SPASM domain-containing protein [Chitinophagales bacterium]
METLQPSQALIAEYNQLRQPAKHHSACFAAANSMFIYPDGYIMPCCHSKDFIYGKYPNKPCTKYGLATTANN